jgi:hypothetical protein
MPTFNIIDDILKTAKLTNSSVRKNIKNIISNESILSSKIRTSGTKSVTLNTGIGKQIRRARDINSDSLVAIRDTQIMAENANAGLRDTSAARMHQTGYIIEAKCDTLDVMNNARTVAGESGADISDEAIKHFNADRFWSRKMRS